jgi:eukaryotic translation initiation factor 2C
LKKWIIVNLSFTQSFTDTNIDLFAKELRSQALEMGMIIRPQSLIVKISKTDDFNPKTTFKGIKAKIQQKFSDIQMILFITPNKSDPFSDDIYSEIKLLGDVDKGFATQCVNVANIWNERSHDRKRKWNRSYLRQLMLKINPKLGGTNVALHESTPAMPSILKDMSLMIIGADVNHPAPADRITSSIAAVVGSYDNEFSHYFTTVSMQPKSREEMIQEFDKMVIEIINNFKKERNNCLPQKVIVFRDGVSEGQFQHVIDNEYSLLEKAFKSFGPNYNPKITFIVVQKRHHTRFVPKQVYNSSDPNPRFQNISPRTVVKKSITHKTDFDFYLCSHEGRLVCILKIFLFNYKFIN